MLKIWKQAWKKEDGSVQGGDDGEDGRCQSQEVDLPHPPKTRPNTPIPSPTEQGRSTAPPDIAYTHAPSSHKKTRSPEPSYHHVRPFKRQKTESSRDRFGALDDNISKHLPEVMDLDENSVLESKEPDAALLKSIVAAAKNQNLIAVLDSNEGRNFAMCDLLKWASGVERDRPNMGIVRRHRVSVIVVNDAEALTSRASQLSKSSLTFSVYTPVLHGSHVNSWADFAFKDAVIIIADIFLDCLKSGALAISQVNVLILDDVQTIQYSTTHPILQVMQDFYEITDPQSRPRIFGILIVPSVTTVLFDLSLLNLEQALDSRIFGVPKTARESVISIPDKPLEIVVFYEPQVKSLETTLHQSVRKLDKAMIIPGMRRHVRDAQLALSEIGPCGCDFIWRRVLEGLISEDKDEPVYEEEDELEEGSPASIAKAKSKLKTVIKNWTFIMPNIDPNTRGFNITHKMLKLIEVLLACKLEAESFRGIIFVQRSIIAYVLSDVIRYLTDKLGFLRPQVLVGRPPAAQNDNQDEIMEGFRSGVYNLLVCTKQAEDLELEPATLVVRFDLFESYVSYAHCRGRTRGRECHLIHMAERGSDVHLRVLSQLARIDASMERWIQRVAVSSTGAVPPCRINDPNDPYRSDSEDEAGSKGYKNHISMFIRDPTTSGKILPSDAVGVVYRYASSLQSSQTVHETEVELKPLFEYERLHDPVQSKETFICTVILPEGAPVSRVSGDVSTSKAIARRLACFQLCKMLFDRGLLDYRMFPRPPLPTTRAQRAAYISMQLVEELSDREDEEAMLPKKVGHSSGNTSKAPGMRCYSRKKPDFWDNSLPVMRGRLYPTIVTPINMKDEEEIVDEADSQDPPRYSPILLLTRLPLPPFFDFNLFNRGVPGRVHMIRGDAFEVDDEQLNDLYKYTIRIIRYITNKPYICALDKMAYFFAPLAHESWDIQLGLEACPISTGSNTFRSDRQSQWQFPSVTDHIPWDRVKLAANNHAVALNTQDLDTLSADVKDAMIQDRWVEFTRRYMCVRMRPDLTPLSKPEDSPREKEYSSLLDYCKARRKGLGALQNDKQPLLEVSRAPFVFNNLNPNSTPAATPKKLCAKYLIPELCVKCTLPASVFRTANLLPPILHRLDEMLLVKEVNAKFFDHSIDERYLHAAISTPSAAAEFDYERLELLGDAYLKYLSSIYLFVTFPSQSEGELHVSRQRIISNRSLLRNSNRCGIPQYIQSKAFTPKVWAPPNFHVYRPTRAPRDEGKDQDGEKEDDVKEDEDSELGNPVAQSEVEKGGSNVRREIPTTSSSMDLDEQPTENSIPPSATQEQETGITKVGSEDTKRKYPLSKKQRQLKDIDAQQLGDKCVADVAEAIIGAAYVTRGRETALKVTKALNIPVPHIDRWSDFGRKAVAPPPEVTARLKEGSIESVERIIGHKFTHPHLLAQALTHTSVQGNEMTSYERLEFIGDAIVDFLVIRHIFDRDSMLSPGALTLLKGAMVSNATLAAVCVWSGLHEHLLFESYVLESDIRAYANDLLERQQIEYENAKREGRMCGQYWADVEPPKALSDVMESIFGAVYVSDNFSPVGSEAFFDKVLKPFYDKHITLQTLSHHPTKILFELFQSRGCQEFEITKDTMALDTNNHTASSSVLIHDIILASATDTSVPSAARRASFLALDAIEGDPTFLARTCNCRTTGQHKKGGTKKALKSFLEGEDTEEQFVESVLNTDGSKRKGVKG